MTDSTQQGIHALQAVFPQLDESSISELHEVSRTQTYAPDVTICEQDDPGDVFFILVTGTVHVIVQTENGPQHIDTLHAPNFFGEMSLLLDQPRAADVVSNGSVTAIEIDRTVFDQRIRSNMRIVTAMNKLVIRKLLNQEQQILARVQSAPLVNADDMTGEQARQRVFVSYAREDQEFVFRLAEDLREHDIDLWVDQREIGLGSVWTEAIEQALEACVTMLLILSPSAVDSRHVADEWHYFLDEEKSIVPLLYEPARIPYPLRRIQRVSFVIKPYEKALEKLVEQLCATVC